MSLSTVIVVLLKLFGAMSSAVYNAFLVFVRAVGVKDFFKTFRTLVQFAITVYWQPVVLAHLTCMLLCS